MVHVLPRSFYERSWAAVTRDLLGKVLVRRLPEGTLRGRIVEVEAYGGQSDPGSHAFRGPTPRNQVMFGPPGRLYVYVSYGMHCCMNVVSEREGTAGATLVRALEPLAGVEIMERNRGGKALVDLCNGPGKLCQAFAITRAQNGADLQGDEIWIEYDGFVPREIATSARVGLSAGGEMRLRFYVADSPFVSRGKPSAPAEKGTG